MFNFFRFMLVLLTGLTFALSACSKKDDPVAQPGTISGQVTPAAAITTVTATSSGGTSATATPNATGTFQLTGLAAGSYLLTFVPAATYIAPAPVPATVTAGGTTQVPNVAVQQSTGSLSGTITPADAVTLVTITDASGHSTTAVPTATGPSHFPASPPAPTSWASTPFI